MRAGQIALVGGDEFSTGCEKADVEILRQSSSVRPKVVIVPTAAAAQNPIQAASNGMVYFSSLGSESSVAMILEKSDACNMKLIAALDEADLVYLTGGDPVHLINTFRNSPMVDALSDVLDRGGSVVGSSAGAMALCSLVKYHNWIDGLGLITGVSVIPHHEGHDPHEIATELKQGIPDGTIVLGIDSMTTCLNRSGSWKILGSGSVTIYKSHGWSKYAEEDSADFRASLQ